MFNTSKSGMSNILHGNCCRSCSWGQYYSVKRNWCPHIYVVHIQLKCYFSIFFVMEPYHMTIYGDCWRQRWIAIINFFCLFLEHKNWFCWKIVLSGSGKFSSKRIIMVKLIEKQLYNDTTFVIWLSQSRKVSTVSG